MVGVVALVVVFLSVVGIGGLAGKFSGGSASGPVAVDSASGAGGAGPGALPVGVPLAGVDPSAHSSLVSLAERGVIRLQPNPDGAIDPLPSVQVRRMEFLVWLDRLAGGFAVSPQAKDEAFFADIPDQAQRTVALNAFAARVAAGTAPQEDGSVLFEPLRPISRTEALAWSVRVLVVRLPTEIWLREAGTSGESLEGLKLRLSSLTPEEVRALAAGFQLETGVRWTAEGRLVRSEAADLLLNLEKALNLQ